jgi:hypothetical protein
LLWLKVKDWRFKRSESSAISGELLVNAIKVNKSEKETDFATSIQGFRRQKIDDRPKPALSQPKKVTEQSAFSGR